MPGPWPLLLLLSAGFSAAAADGEAEEALLLQVLQHDAVSANPEVCNHGTQDECDEAPACYWDNEGGDCHQSACDTFQDDQSCPNVGCVWYHDRCTVSCDGFDDEDSCPQSRCVWKTSTFDEMAQEYNTVGCKDKPHKPASPPVEHVEGDGNQESAPNGRHHYAVEECGVAGEKVHSDESRFDVNCCHPTTGVCVDKVCFIDLTYSEAYLECGKKGLRLCSIDEMRLGNCCGDCNFDISPNKSPRQAKPVWTDEAPPFDSATADSS